MHFVSYLIAGILILLAAIVFIGGLVRLQKGKANPRGLINGGFLLGVCGIVAGAVLYGFFNL